MDPETPSLPAVEKVHLRLGELGWTLGDLAEKMGVKVKSLRNLLSGNNPSGRARHRCECALGRVPIWNSPAEVARRKAAAEFFDADPRRMSRVRLQAMVGRVLRPAGYPARLCQGGGLVERLEAFAVGEVPRSFTGPDALSNRSPEAVRRRISAALLSHGVSRRKLAGWMGYKSPDPVTAIISGRDRSPRRRRHLENVMGGAAWWSTPEEVAARQPVISFYGGADPFTLSGRALTKLRRKHLVPAGVRGRFTRDALVAKLEEHALRASAEEEAVPRSRLGTARLRRRHASREPEAVLAA